MVLITGIYLSSGSSEDTEMRMDLDTPSPALGEAVANSIHQVLTDPYTIPLEKLANYLTEDIQHDMITIDQLNRWTLDDYFPICFIWDCDGSRIQVDKGASPWILNRILTIVREGLLVENPDGLPFINSFHVEGEEYWLGFLKVPLLTDEPNQVAGVFFSIDRYLAEHVPRLIDNLVKRRYFPLVDFQRDDQYDFSMSDGDISFRILDEMGELFLQRGRTFDEDKLIYASSQWYDERIVCLKRGWDLQVFSVNAGLMKTGEAKRGVGILMYISALVLGSLFYWIGIGKSRRKVVNTRKMKEI